MVLRTTGKAIGAVLATGFTAVAAAAALLIYLLSQGPISLNFLTPHIKEAVEAYDPTIKLEVGDTILSWQGWERQLDLRLVDVTVQTTSGKEVAKIPQLSAGVDLSALFTGRLVAHELEIFGPRLRVTRHADGELRFAVGHGDHDHSHSEVAALLDRMGTDTSESGIVGSLQRLSIYNAELIYRDEILPLTVRAPAAGFEFQRLDNAIRLVLAGRVRIADMATHLRFAVTYTGGESAVPIELVFTDLEAEKLPDLLGLKDVELSQILVDAVLRAQIGNDGRFGDFEFDVSSGPGRVAVPEHAANVYELSESMAKGKIDISLERFFFDSFSAKLKDGVVVAGQGEMARNDGGFSLDFSGDLLNAKVEQVSKHWPSRLADQGRDWIAEHLSGGRINKATWAVKLSDKDLSAEKPSKDVFNLAFSFSGITVDYLPPMPKILDAAGEGVLHANSFDLRVNRGRSGDLKLSHGILKIADFSAQPPVMKIDFQVDGPVQSALKVIDSKPLELLDGLGLSKSETTGRSQTKVALHIPLRKRFRAHHIGYKVSAKVNEGRTPKIVDRVALDDAAFDLTADNKQIAVKGKSRVDGVPADLSIRHQFASKDRPSTDRVDVKAILSTAQQKALGLDLEPYLKGKVPVTLVIQREGEATPQVTGQADLTAAALDIPPIEWSKVAGAPAVLRFQTELKDSEDFVLDRFEFDAKGLQARGRLRLGPKRSFRELDLGKLKFAGNDLAVTLARRGPGWNVRLSGNRLDLSRYIERLEDRGEAGVDWPDLDVDAKLNRVRLADDVDVARAALSGRWRGGRLRSLYAYGNINGGPPVRADLALSGSVRKLEISTRAGGEVLRAMGLFHNAYGGALNLEAHIPDQPTRKNPIKGLFRVDDFTIAKAPTLGEILSRGELTEFVDNLSGDGVKFTRMGMPFTLADGRLVVDELRAVGPQFGVTLRGVVNRETEALDLQGNVIPAYTLNSALGNIPILGPLFTGGEGGGVFAVTYRVKGTISNPETSVNTLSAFAPGFLRSIIDSLDAPAMDKEGARKLVEPDYDRPTR